MIKITDSLEKLSNQIFRLIPQPKPSLNQLKHTKIIAHRGCWNTKERLENTLPAFIEALNYDIWAIEFDIRWTKDNIPIIHHDPNTGRIFGTDLQIAETEFKELRKEIPQIPRLDELVRTLGGNIHFMMELKNKCTDEQVNILKKILAPLKPIEDYHFMSLDLDRFTNLHFSDSKAFVSIARTNIKSIYQASTKMDLGGFTGQYLLLTGKMTDQCHKQNILVGTGFSDNKFLFYREANRGIDWIFTNKAIEIAELKSKLLS